MTADDAPRWEPHPGRLPAGPDWGRRRLRQLMIGSALVAYSWVAASAAPFSMRALLGVLFPGAMIGAIAYGRPPERLPAPDSLDITGSSYWLIAIAALFEWEASAVRDGTPWWHPSLTALIDPLIAPHPVKSAAFLAWLLGGWALLRR